MIKFFFAIAIIGICSGCVDSKNFSGKFAGPNEVVKLEMYPNQTYIYTYKAFHVSEYSTGTWSQSSKNEFLLSSSRKNTSFPVAINAQNTLSDDMDISFKFTSELPLLNYRCAIFIDDTLYRVNEMSRLQKALRNINDTGVMQEINYYFYSYIRCDLLKELSMDFGGKKIFFKLAKQQIEPFTNRNFRIEMTSDTLQLSTLKNKQLAITINDSAFSYIIFNDVRVLRNRKGLILVDKDAPKPIYLKKQR